MAYEVVLTDIALKNLKKLLSDSEKLEDYLDFLHLLKVKAQTTQRMPLEEAKRQLFDP